jgi:hypothetical protein
LPRERDACGLFALTPEPGSWLLSHARKGVVVWNGNELLLAATVLAWAALVALGIALDAHAKFRSLLGTPRPDEWDMSPVWERRSHRWRGVGQVAFGVSIFLSVTWIVGRTAA